MRKFTANPQPAERLRITLAEAAAMVPTPDGKRSAAVDFTQAEGQAIVRELAVQADIVVENFRVGGLAKYGLDYANLAAISSLTKRS